MTGYHEPEDEFWDDPTEAYCVRCRVTVEIDLPEAVWTRKGTPATRGVCPECSGTVFRMGRTDAHDESKRPSAIAVTGDKRKGPVLSPDTVYVLYAEEDESIARQLAGDLSDTGVATWMHEHDPEDVKWAGGVHPALKECRSMLVVLSPAAILDSGLEENWTFFRQRRKPVIIAQVAEDTPPPDDLRRSPRFDFSSQEYKRAFRQMIQTLG